MRKKARVVVSVAMGLLAAVLTCWYVTSVREEAQVRQRETIESYGGDVTRVCVATRDIEPGERSMTGALPLRIGFRVCCPRMRLRRWRRSPERRRPRAYPSVLW